MKVTIVGQYEDVSFTELERICTTLCASTPQGNCLFQIFFETEMIEPKFHCCSRRKKCHKRRDVVHSRLFPVLLTRSGIRSSEVRQGGSAKKYERNVPKHHEVPRQHTHEHSFQKDCSPPSVVRLDSRCAFTPWEIQLSVFFMQISFSSGVFEPSKFPTSTTCK